MSVSRHPYFSIIIPTFNSATTIERSILSLILQEFTNFECIIIDNNSTDSTVNIIFKNTLLDNRFKLIVEKDKGIYDAFNKGIKFSKGKYLYFLGSDDYLYNNQVLQNIYQECLSSNDIVYGDILYSCNSAKESGIWSIDLMLTKCINHQRIFYKKTLFDDYGFFNLKYLIASDYDLNLKLFTLSHLKIQYTPILIAIYNTTGLSSKKWDYVFWDSWLDVFPIYFINIFPLKKIYKSLSIYCIHLFETNQYFKCLKIFFKIIYKTKKIGILFLLIKIRIRSFYK